MREEPGWRSKHNGEESCTAKSSRERSHQVDKDENIIPIDHETAELIVQQKKLFREKFGREPGPEDPLFCCFSIQASPRPNFSALSPKKKYGRAYCRLQAILK